MRVAFARSRTTRVAIVTDEDHRRVIWGAAFVAAITAAGSTCGSARVGEEVASVMPWGLIAAIWLILVGPIIWRRLWPSRP